MEDAWLNIEYNDAFHVASYASQHALASESRMVVHVTVGTIDAWIFVNSTIKVE